MIAKLRQDTNELRREVRSLRASRAPGILTNRTTRGVIRRPLRNGNTTRNTDGGAARWA
jgi:hypothetical protein